MHCSRPRSCSELRGNLITTPLILPLSRHLRRNIVNFSTSLPPRPAGLNSNKTPYYIIILRPRNLKYNTLYYKTIIEHALLTAIIVAQLQYVNV